MPALRSESIPKTRDTIKSFIKNGLATADSDSPVHDSLSNLRVTLKSKRLPAGEHRYSVAGARGKEIRFSSGDISTIRDIDVWVNSENTNLQMARFFDRSISSVIRYRGATMTALGHVDQDLIADELRALLKQDGAKAIPPGMVVATTSGELLKTNRVKRIYHAASVVGELGRGYKPIPNVVDCVTNALVLADSDREAEHEVGSILFQIMGSGTARGNPGEVADELLGAAVTYLETQPESRVEHVYFLITRERTLAVWQGAMAEFGDRVAEIEA